MFKRLIASIICLTFSFSNLQYVQAQDFSINQLPVPGTMVGESTPFAPLALKGLIVNPQKPLEFQFIVDTGKGPQDTASIKEEANQLVKYFLAGLTIPEGDLWVNLSPYEKNRMVPEVLGETDLGRDLLAQDYILKQLTASLIYPEKDLGKEFWSRVYAKAQQQFGTTNIPVSTFNKVWILPDQAQVYENGSAAYVTKSTLKVMLDEDYLALSHHVIPAKAGIQNMDNTHSIASNIVRQIILPEIEKEVNTGKNFAPLRQIYQALILAKWYKETIQNGLLDAVYTNKNKVAGVNLADPAVKEQIYERYLKAYKKGAFNYIKEDPTPDGQVVPRKYFSGGLELMPRKLRRDGDGAMISKKGWAVGALLLLTVGCASINVQYSNTELSNGSAMEFKNFDSSNDQVRRDSVSAYIKTNLGDKNIIQQLKERLLSSNNNNEKYRLSLVEAYLALGGELKDAFPIVKELIRSNDEEIYVDFIEFLSTLDSVGPQYKDIFSDLIENSYKDYKGFELGFNEALFILKIPFTLLPMGRPGYYGVYEGHLENPDLTPGIQEIKEYNTRIHNFEKIILAKISTYNFNEAEFNETKTPGTLLEALRKSISDWNAVAPYNERIDIPDAKTPIESLNKLLENPDLFWSMKKRPDECQGLINMYLGEDELVKSWEIKRLNRLLIEDNFPKETPEWSINGINSRSLVPLQTSPTTNPSGPQSLLTPSTNTPVSIDAARMEELKRLLDRYQGASPYERDLIAVNMDNTIGGDSHYRLALKEGGDSEKKALAEIQDIADGKPDAAMLQTGHASGPQVADMLRKQLGENGDRVVPITLYYPLPIDREVPSTESLRELIELFGSNQKLVVFDGVGDDSRVVVTFDNYKKEKGITPSVYISQKALFQDAAMLDQNINDITQKDLSDEKHRRVTKLLNSPGGIEPYPNTIRLIKDLKQAGTKLAVGTSSTSATLVLNRLNIRNDFDVIVDGNTAKNEVIPSKPSPEFYLTVARKLGVDPKRSVVVEDAVSGVEAAAKGGFGLVIGLARANDEEQLKNAGADVVLKDIGDLTVEQIKSHLAAKLNLNSNDVLQGVIFDLDGTISNTTPAHFQAWKETFDNYLRLREKELGEPFEEFSMPDYLEHINGKTSPEGVRAFLESRKINIPVGDSAMTEQTQSSDTSSDFAMKVKATAEECDLIEKEIGKIEDQLNAGQPESVLTQRRQLVAQVMDGLRNGSILIRHENTDVLKSFDKDAEPIGAVDRELVEKLFYIHQTVNAFVFTPTGEVLLQRRVVGITYPLHLTILGGHLTAGQKYKEGIKKELSEKLDLPVLAGKLSEIGIDKYDRPNDPNRERRMLYAYVLTPEEYVAIMAKNERLKQARESMTKDEYIALLAKEREAKSGFGEVWEYYPVSLERIEKADKDENKDSKIGQPNRYFKIENIFKDGKVERNAFFTPDLFDLVLDNPHLMSPIREETQILQNVVKAKWLLRKIRANEAYLNTPEGRGADRSNGGIYDMVLMADFNDYTDLVKIIPSEFRAGLPDPDSVGSDDLHTRGFDMNTYNPDAERITLENQVTEHLLAQQFSVLMYNDVTEDELQKKDIDVLMIPGNDDINVYRKVLDLKVRGIGKYILISGGTGRLTQDIKRVADANGFKVEMASEAEMIRSILIQMAQQNPKWNGLVPDLQNDAVVILEPKAAFTVQNFSFAKVELKKRGLLPDQGAKALKILYIQKPLQQLRTKGNFESVFKDEIAQGRVEGVSFTTDYAPNNKVRGDIVGEFFRIIANGQKGDWVTQKGYSIVPDNKWIEALELFNTMELKDKDELVKVLWSNVVNMKMTKEDVLRNLPEKAGIFAKAILDYLDSMRQREAADLAMHSASSKTNQLVENGGIDLNQINVLRNGKTINVQFDPAQLNELMQGGFEGFTPIIINITPIQSPFKLLGINPEKEAGIVGTVVICAFNKYMAYFNQVN